MEIDFEMIEKAGYSSATPVIITSQNRFEIISMGNNKINQEIIKLI